MKSSIKNFFGQKPRTGESSNPKMEQNEDITEIKGLDDRCVDALDSIERDAATASSLPSAPLPPLNEDVFRRFVKTLDDDCAIAIAFLTNPVPEQAHAICQKIESRKFVPANLTLTSSEYLFHILLNTAKAKNLKPVWHFQFMAAVYYIGRLKRLCKEINKNSGEAENVAIKDSKFEQWCQRLQDPRVIDPARVQIFKICQNLTSAEAVDLYNILKNDIEQSSSLAKDATPMQQADLSNFRYAETKFLELMMSTQPSEIVRKAKACLNQVVRDMDEQTYDQTFGPIFSMAPNGQNSEHQGSAKNKSHKLCLQRGLCLIINNEKFANKKYSIREGSTKDADVLEYTWKRFSCDVTKRTNRTAEQLLDDLKKFRNLLNTHKDNNDATFFAVICILSHGRSSNGEEEIMGVDGKGVKTDTITDMFNDSDKCPGMSGKVKLFLIQACRGDDSQGPAAPVAIATTPEDTVTTDGAIPRSTAPKRSNYVIANSTLKNSVSYRDKCNGSFFIQAICEVLNECRNGELQLDLVSILGVANHRAFESLKKKSRDLNEQVSDVHQTLMVGAVHLPNTVQLP